MDTFTFGIRRNWLFQALGTNPLVRRSDPIQALSYVAKIGDRQAIWIDDDGQYAQPPRPPSRATTDAWAIGLVVWFALFDAVAGTYYAIRWRLDSRRLAQWDLEINRVAEGGDRKNLNDKSDGLQELKDDQFFVSNQRRDKANVQPHNA